MKKPFVLKIMIGAVLCSLIIIFTLLPKPSLVTYEKAGIRSKSIYWQGFNEYGRFFDSNASYVKKDNDSPYLHVCYSLTDTSTCQRFTIVNEQGVIAVLLHWIDS